MANLSPNIFQGGGKVKTNCKTRDIVNENISTLKCATNLFVKTGWLRKEMLTYIQIERKKCAYLFLNSFQMRLQIFFGAMQKPEEIEAKNYNQNQLTKQSFNQSINQTNYSINKNFRQPITELVNQSIKYLIKYSNNQPIN